jgi:CO/xanthine dehydrogenase Mo-binding subunit
LEDGLAVPYSISGKSARALLAEIDLPTGPWRAVVNGPNAFANECFFDEVAAALEKDPYEFRLSLLPETNPLYGALQLAAERAGWGTPLAEGHGRGIACHTYHQTAAAMVAEVSVDGGVVKVHKVVCAINCGLAIHPDMVAQQMEGCVAYALTSLLKGEITFADGRVQQNNFNDYPLLQMSEMPEVEVHIVPSTAAPRGVGEMGVPPLVPAVLNALYTATGVRIRHTPIRVNDLAAA